MSFNFVDLASFCVALATSYCVIKTTYNLFIHPLSTIPGPKVAAATSLWLFYSDYKGHSDVDLSDCHERYGPVIRISPNEVSIRDIDLFRDVIYAQNTKYQKSNYYYRAFRGAESDVFAETDKTIHAAEKRLMSHAFSRANLLGYQRDLYKNTKKWVQRLRGYVESDRVIPLWHATQCLTLDAICEFSFGLPAGGLESEDFSHPVFLALETFAPLVTIFRHFPMVHPVGKALQGLFSFGLEPFNKIVRAALEALKQKEGWEEKSGMVMFDSIMARAEKNGIHVSHNRLVQNGSLMVGAGTGTTALVLTTAIYYLNAQPELWKELQAILLEKFPNASAEEPDIVELEKIQLLEACVKESMRVSVPIRGRFPRDVPEGGLSIHGFHVPQGYMVCSSVSFYCYNPAVFPEPRSFKARRWLDTDNAHGMQRNLVVFSQGPRSCIGQNFAQAELKIALSQILMNFNPGKVIDQTLGFHAHGITSPNNLGRIVLKPLMEDATTDST